MPEKGLSIDQYKEFGNWVESHAELIPRRQLQVSLGGEIVYGMLYVVGNDPLILTYPYRSVLGEVAPRIIYSQSQTERLAEAGFVSRELVLQQGASTP